MAARSREEPLDSQRASPVMKHKPYNEPTEVTAEDGEVHLDGPDGVDVSMTPEAALETSDRLLSGGLKAQGQMVEATRRGLKVEYEGD